MPRRLKLPRLRSFVAAALRREYKPLPHSRVSRPSRGPAGSCCTLLLRELCKVKAPCYSDTSVPGTGLTPNGSKHLPGKNQRASHLVCSSFPEITSEQSQSRHGRFRLKQSPSQARRVPLTAAHLAPWGPPCGAGPWAASLGGSLRTQQLWRCTPCQDFEPLDWKS